MKIFKNKKVEVELGINNDYQQKEIIGKTYKLLTIEIDRDYLLKTTIVTLSILGIGLYIDICNDTPTRDKNLAQIEKMSNNYLKKLFGETKK